MNKILLALTVFASISAVMAAEEGHHAEAAAPATEVTAPVVKEEHMKETHTVTHESHEGHHAEAK